MSFFQINVATPELNVATFSNKGVKMRDFDQKMTVFTLSEHKSVKSCYTPFRENVATFVATF